MDKKTSKILFRAEDLLIRNKNDDSIYFKELRKTYREYREIELPDKTTNDLYLEHIDRLCDIVEQKRYSTILIFGMIFMIVLCTIICIYSLSRNASMQKTFNSKFSIYNEKINLDVKYENIENFNALALSDKSEYLDLLPLTLKINATTKNTINVHYDIYLEEDNSSLKKDSVLDKSDLFFNAKSENRDNGVKLLSDASLVRNKILVFSSETKTNREEKVDLRMWIDNHKIESLNKKYRFSISVSCYPV